MNPSKPRKKERGIPRIEQLYVTIRLYLDYPRRTENSYFKALEALDELATLARERSE